MTNKNHPPPHGISGSWRQGHCLNQLHKVLSDGSPTRTGKTLSPRSFSHPSLPH